ncbi:MAG: hypothetical protein IH613_17625 [Desulfuromonadales bacterium]|nr:hypothetical protein [Desulfuromonadales bacterium]
MKVIFTLTILMVSIAMTLMLTACEKKGPAEKAGEKVDQAVEETKEDLQQTKEKLEDAVKK